jgi:adenylyltransferase/sulfurtransferase
MLSKEERERYQRQIILEKFGEEAQEKLKQAKVALFGLGGLGGTASIYLTVAGVGRLSLFDPEKVEVSNLNRQILYGSSEIGKRKVQQAKKKLSTLNPFVQIDVFEGKLENLVEAWQDADLLIDCLDNLESRLFLNQKAVELERPLISAAVEGWDGYLYTYLPNQTACLNCLFREKSSKKGVFPVIGVTPGLLGLLEATEAIKLIIGEDASTVGKILLANLKNLTFNLVTVKKNSRCEVCR